MIHKRGFSTAATTMLFLLALTVGRAQETYQVTLDTSTLNGQMGNLYLQFNPGGLDALAATATITNVVTDGSLAGTASTTGGVTGTLPGPPPVTITNSTQLNSLFQGITFGNQITFDTTFTGPALTPTMPYPSSGSTFAVSLYDSTGNNALLTTNPDGSMLHIDVNPNGVLDAKTFTDANGVFDASVTELSSVPESASVVSLFIGMGLLGGLSLRLARKATGTA